MNKLQLMPRGISHSTGTLASTKPEIDVLSVYTIMVIIHAFLWHSTINAMRPNHPQTQRPNITVKWMAAWPSWSQLAKLQCTQNSAARLVLCKPRRESATPLLKRIHWLPVKARIEYKVSTLCYPQCLNSVTMPSCLCELLQTCKPTSGTLTLPSGLLFRDSLWILSDSNWKIVQSAVFGPATWSSVTPGPVHVRQSQCLVTFKKQLKTYLFTKHLS